MNSNKPTAIVYIDGLNLYKRILEISPSYKWLDVVKLSEALFPSHDVREVKYFTSRVSSQPHDIGATDRQYAYLTALQTLEPRLSIHFGKMRAYTAYLPTVPIQFDSTGNTRRVKVRKIEEKGSDVALASTMVLDAATGKADLYALISTDSDFAPTLRILRSELRVATGLVFGSSTPPRALLGSKPLILKQIRSSVLAHSQLPESVTVAGAIIRKPSSWF